MLVEIIEKDQTWGFCEEHFIETLKLPHVGLSIMIHDDEERYLVEPISFAPVARSYLQPAELLLDAAFRTATNAITPIGLKYIGQFQFKPNRSEFVFEGVLLQDVNTSAWTPKKEILNELYSRDQITRAYFNTRLSVR